MDQLLKRVRVLKNIPEKFNEKLSAEFILNRGSLVYVTEDKIINFSDIVTELIPELYALKLQKYYINLKIPDLELPCYNGNATMSFNLQNIDYEDLLNICMSFVKFHTNDLSIELKEKFTKEYGYDFNNFNFNSMVQAIEPTYNFVEKKLYRLAKKCLLRYGAQDRSTDVHFDLPFESRKPSELAEEIIHHALNSTTSLSVVGCVFLENPNLLTLSMLVRKLYMVIHALKSERPGDQAGLLLHQSEKFQLKKEDTHFLKLVLDVTERSNHIGCFLQNANRYLVEENIIFNYK